MFCSRLAARRKPLYRIQSDSKGMFVDVKGEIFRRYKTPSWSPDPFRPGVEVTVSPSNQGPDYCVVSVTAVSERWKKDEPGHKPLFTAGLLRRASWEEDLLNLYPWLHMDKLGYIYFDPLHKKTFILHRQRNNSVLLSNYKDIPQDQLDSVFDILAIYGYEETYRDDKIIWLSRASKSYRDWETDRKSTRLNSSHSG